MSSLTDSAAPYVEDGSVPGLVAAVERGGEPEVVVPGGTGPGCPPLRRDTIFRIRIPEGRRLIHAPSR